MKSINQSKVVPVTGAGFSGITMDQSMCASLFPYPLLVCSGHVRYRKYPSTLMADEVNYYTALLQYTLYIIGVLHGPKSYEFSKGLGKI